MFGGLEFFKKFSPLFADFQSVQVETLQGLYVASLEPYQFILIDYKLMLKKQIKGLDQFVHAAMSNRVFSIQESPNDQISFLQYYPLGRFSETDFKNLMPWNQSVPGTRKQLRFQCAVSVSINDQNHQDERHRGINTYAQNISLSGASVIGHFNPSSTLFLQFPECSEDLKIEAIVKWASPWGKCGIIPASGLEFRHSENSLKQLRDYFNKIVVPYVINHLI